MTALLERESELATIEELLDAARDGAGGLLMIEGEAGAGKSSLLTACADLAAAGGMLLLRARGGEYERDFPTASCVSSLSQSSPKRLAAPSC